MDIIELTRLIVKINTNWATPDAEPLTAEEEALSDALYQNTQDNLEALGIDLDTLKQD